MPHNALKNNLQQQQNVKLTTITTTTTSPATTMLPIINELPVEPEDTDDDYTHHFIAGEDALHLLNSTTHSIANSVSSSSLNSLMSNCSSNSTADSLTTISQKPSNASKHFENTYKLLGQQLENNCQRTAEKLQQLDKSVDSSLDSSCCSSMMSAIVHGTGPAPTRLELELEAVERMRIIVQQLKVSSSVETTASAPLLALLHDFAAKGQPESHSNTATPVPSPITGAIAADGPNFELPPELLDKANSWELMYYASKNVDGRNCLKVVRSLLTNKGKQHTFCNK
ncbi:GH13508 [Drosophila grimshawi]|uniref:GH13508 n=1 Tax=Drosophila grimshawi TaxID=7222 RepID=B4JPF1_DROGR|nr:GH13508 [Drosophila grimshawi]